MVTEQTKITCTGERGEAMTSEEKKEMQELKNQINGLIILQAKSCSWQRLPFDKRDGLDGLLACLHCDQSLCLYDSAAVLSSLGIKINKMTEVKK